MQFERLLFIPYIALTIMIYQIARYTTFKVIGFVPELSYPIVLTILWLSTAIITMIILK